MKRVTNAGTIRFEPRLLVPDNSLTQHPVGREEIGDGRLKIFAA